jgi:dolichol-phosphate mannosyltransferase
VLPTLVQRWDEGFDIVNATKRSRGRESVVYRAFAKLFNVALSQAIGGNLQGASDFKLLDRGVVDVLLSLPEKTRFFRGLVHWVGFTATDVPFEVAPRVAGQSKWGVLGLVRYSIRNLLAFSALPLRFVATLGFSTLGFAFVLGVWTLYRKLVRGDALTGFTTVILLQLILGGLLLSGVGVIALYLSAIFEELKGRPTYIVRPTPRTRRGGKA